MWLAPNQMGQCWCKAARGEERGTFINDFRNADTRMGWTRAQQCVSRILFFTWFTFGFIQNFAYNLQSWQKSRWLHWQWWPHLASGAQHGYFCGQNSQLQGGFIFVWQHYITPEMSAGYTKCLQDGEKSEVGLDSTSRRSKNVRFHVAGWVHPVILLHRWPSNYAWMV